MVRLVRCEDAEREINGGDERAGAEDAMLLRELALLIGLLWTRFSCPGNRIRPATCVDEPSSTSHTIHHQPSMHSTYSMAYPVSC
jgi:hypothetical protein